MRIPSNCIEDSEKIGRFIFSSDHFSRTNKTVKYAAFMPARDNMASVYRINDYTEEEISDLDKKFVSGKRTDGRMSKGRADLLAGQIRQTGLDVKAEPTPHKDHANIEGYSNDKSANKLKAIELARHATLVLQEGRPKICCGG